MWLSIFIRTFTKAFTLALIAGMIVFPSLSGAESEVRIDILKSPGRKIKVALPLFYGAEGGDASAQLRDTLERDLKISGFFEVLNDLPEEMVFDGMKCISNPEGFERLVGVGIELLFNVHSQNEGSRKVFEGYVFDAVTRQQIFGKRYKGPAGAESRMIHIMAGDMIQKITGIEPLTRSRLAYLWDRSGNKQVFISDYDSRNPKAVSPGGELALFPQWLPDARSLVYTSFVSGLPELVYQDVDRNHQKILTSYPGMNATVSFSPGGGDFLATLSKDGNPEIYKLNMAGKIIQRMTYSQAVDTSPSYSPDGRRFTFVSDRSGGPKIYIMNAKGGRPVRVTFRGHYNVSPDWSPDGKYIAYSSIVDGRFQIMLLEPDSGRISQLTDGPGNKEDPDWGRDGRHLVFTLTKGYKSDLYIVDIYSKESMQITKGQGNFTSPSWSDEGP